MKERIKNNLTFPFLCISYYASSKNEIDHKHSFDYWMRSKLVRIVSDKSFARGDVLKVNSVENTSSGIVINVEVQEEWNRELPVLCFVSSRLVYNRWSKFKFKPTVGIQIVEPIEQVLSGNYSIGLILLCYKSGKINCKDDVGHNEFDVLVNLNWE